MSCVRLVLLMSAVLALAACPPPNTSSPDGGAVSDDAGSNTDDDAGANNDDDAGANNGDDDAGANTGDDDAGANTGDDDAGANTDADAGVEVDAGPAPVVDCAERTLPFLVVGVGEYSTMANAVAAAPAGATIEVCPGTYAVSVLIERELTVQGAGRGVTIFDGSAGGRIFSVDEVNFTLRDATVQNGQDENGRFGGNCHGGGIVFNDLFGTTLHLQVDRVDFIGNETALCVDDRMTATISDCVFSENIGSQGGGIFSYGNTTVENSTFVGNEVSNYGGAMYLSYGSVVVRDSLVRQNTAAGGGGVYIQSPLTLNVTNSDFGAGEVYENVPDDVGCYTDSFGFFGADVDFTCNIPEYDECSCSLQ